MSRKPTKSRPLPSEVELTIVPGRLVKARGASGRQREGVDRPPAEASLCNQNSIALGFRGRIKSDRCTQLLQWIAKTKRCEFGPVVRFAYGLQKDISAVAAAESHPYPQILRREQILSPAPARFQDLCGSI
jgi:hypothetical protein